MSTAAADSIAVYLTTTIDWVSDFPFVPSTVLGMSLVSTDARPEISIVPVNNVNPITGPTDIPTVPSPLWINAGETIFWSFGGSLTSGDFTYPVCAVGDFAIPSEPCNPIPIATLMSDNFGSFSVTGAVFAFDDTVQIGTWEIHSHEFLIHEPATVSLLGLGLAGLGFSCRRKRPRPPEAARVTSRREHRMASSIKRSLILAVAATSTMLSVGQVRATVITFDGLAHYSGYSLYSYHESGFTVAGSGSFVEWFGSGNPLPSIETRWPGGFGPPRTVQVTSGDLFTFDAVDIRTTVGIVDYTIRGLLGGRDEFVLLTGSADDGASWTHVLGDSSTLIDTLIITLTRVSAYSANIDNIGVTAVPEPTTLALLALGLAGLGFSRRRKLN